MTQGSASHREDVEQLVRPFAEFRSTHAVRSRLPGMCCELLRHRSRAEHLCCRERMPIWRGIIT
jgi:hypothetical protein